MQLPHLRRGAFQAFPLHSLVQLFWFYAVLAHNPLCPWFCYQLITLLQVGHLFGHKKYAEGLAALILVVDAPDSAATQKGCDRNGATISNSMDKASRQNILFRLLGEPVLV